MSDKFRTTTPISTRFSEGEIVDPTKLDGFALQTERALSIMEYLVGDLWNDGGDAFFQSIGLTDAAIMIPNIARSIGAFPLLNPRIPNLSDTTQYSHVPLADDVDQYELFLSLPPTAGTTFTVTGTGAPTGQPEIDLGNVASAGEWYVNRTTGWCFFTDPIQSDWVITYIPTVASEMDSEATCNIMPDPNTDSSYSFRGCKIAYANNVDNSEGYIIYLPPRGPLSTTRRADRSPQSQFDASNNANNMSVSPGSLPVKFWQHYDNSGTPVDATTGSYAEHYRYAVPKILSDNWSAASSLPMGFIYLWDPSQTGAFIEGLSFSAENAPSPSTYILIASGAALDTWVASYMDTAYAACGGTAALTQRDDHDPTFYPANGLRVVTVGNSLSLAISKLSKTLLDHDHGSANSQPGKPVSHSQLKGNSPGRDSETDITIYPSSLPQDDHPQYLYRFGSGYIRDGYQNGMLGPLLMCSTGSTGNYLNITSNSNKILFGHPSTGPQLGFRSSTGNLDVIGNGFGIVRSATYFSVQIDGSGYVSLNTNAGPLVLKPQNDQLLLGAVGNGDYFSWTASTYLALFIGGTLATYTRKSGSYITQYIGSGMRLTDDGTYLAVEDQSTTIGDHQDGQLVVSRIHGGEHNDTVGPYGTSGGDYGPVRQYVVPIQDFLVFDYNASDGYVENPVSQHIVGYGDGGGLYKKDNYVLYLPDNSSDTIGIAYINLPFAKYGIVNVRFSLMSYNGISGTGQGHVALGHSISSNLSTNPTGDDAAIQDYQGCGYIGSSSVTWYYDVRGFAVTTGAPLVEIDNTYTGGVGTSYGKIPWVRFYTEGSGVNNHFYISAVRVLYRIKEW